MYLQGKTSNSNYSFAMRINWGSLIFFFFVIDEAAINLNIWDVGLFRAQIVVNDKGKENICSVMSDQQTSKLVDV